MPVGSNCVELIPLLTMFLLKLLFTVGYMLYLLLVGNMYFVNVISLVII